MTSYTTYMEIPYPDPSDSSCTVDDSLDAAAEVVGSILDGYLETLRDKVEVPFFMVSLSPGGTIYNADYAVRDDALTAYDTVDFDPCGLADLERDNHSVRILNSGIVLMGSCMMVAGMPTATRHQMYPRTYVDRGSSMFLAGDLSSDPAGGYMVYMDTNAEGYVNMQYFNSSATTTGTSVRSSMWGLRISREAP